MNSIRETIQQNNQAVLDKFNVIWEGQHLGGALRFYSNPDEPDLHVYFIFDIMDDTLDGKIIFDPKKVTKDTLATEAFEAVTKTYYRLVAQDLVEVKMNGRLQ